VRISLKGASPILSPGYNVCLTYSKSSGFSLSFMKTETAPEMTTNILSCSTSEWMTVSPALKIEWFEIITSRRLVSG
jgi:hypothetical protein